MSKTCKELAARLSPLIAHLLDVELEPGQPHARSLDPRALQSQLVAAMRILMESLLARTPLVIAFEDFHWTDAASTELLSVLLELTDFLPLMILVICRPDVEGGSWEFRFHAQRNYPHRLSEIQLHPLTPEQADLLIRNLLHASQLPEDLQHPYRWLSYQGVSERPPNGRKVCDISMKRTEQPPIMAM
ncbi:MAG: hypothetical protein GY850_18255 [bacterium]|nr:hypothetical protein [bacterium]